jgi:hypothetical protein
VQTLSTGELFDFRPVHQLWEKEKCGLRASLEALERLQVQLNTVTTVSEVHSFFLCNLIRCECI